MSDLRYRVGVDGVGESVASLGQVAGATRGAGTAAREAASGTADFGQSAQNAASRIAGVSNAVASLAGRLGQPGVASAASLIGSVAGSTAQFAAMGAMLGPGGALVGGIVGLATSAIPALMQALNPVPSAQAHVATETERATEAFLSQSVAAHTAELSIRDFVASLSLGGLTTRGQALADEITTVADEIANLTAEGSRYFDQGTLIAEQSRLRARMRSLTAEAEANAAEVAANTGTRRRGGGGGSRVNPLDALTGDAAGGDLFRTLSEEGGARDDQARTAARLAEQAQIEKSTQLQEAAAEQARAHAEAQRELLDATNEASHAFSDGYVNSLDQVIARWRDLERTSRASGTAMLGQGRLLERGMVAVGNSIAETIGGTMKGAFQDALGAWLDGSLSFVEAAERMAKGVIKALVTESIVQAIVEGARAIASIASQDYVGAATHAAAAAAWAAVGVVAGGVGAGIGAFGGGGEKGGSATSSTADASRERQRDQGPSGNVTLNVYPGGYITARDVRAGIVQALNEADREGVRPSFAGR